MKFAIVVHGRFYAFDLARALIKRGHRVRLFTNYPKWAVRRFGISDDCVESFPLHGLLTKAINGLGQLVSTASATPQMHQMFGRWVADRVLREDWDVIQCFSGVAEELLTRRRRTNGKCFVVRGSAHIRIQDRLLMEEGERTSQAIDRPHPWMVEREEREYGLCDRIIVLSTFAYESFVQRGVPKNRLEMIPLGVNTEAFRADEKIVVERQSRILSRRPLQVLMVGTLSLRKGAWDLARISNSLSTDECRFRFVGDIAPDVQRLMKAFAPIDLIPRQPELRLPHWYEDNDVFLFPTIEDGFAAVLAQAAASGLPILTTTNCTGRDLVREGITGWVLPIRSPEKFVEKLRWCHEHRDELSDMVRRIHQHFQPRDWDDVAADFEEVCKKEMVVCG